MHPIWTQIHPLFHSDLEIKYSVVVNVRKTKGGIVEIETTRVWPNIIISQTWYNWDSLPEERILHLLRDSAIKSEDFVKCSRYLVVFVMSGVIAGPYNKIYL